jgi:hypothetical protein
LVSLLPTLVPGVQNTFEGKWLLLSTLHPSEEATRSRSMARCTQRCGQGKTTSVVTGLTGGCLQEPSILIVDVRGTDLCSK